MQGDDDDNDDVNGEHFDSDGDDNIGSRLSHASKFTFSSETSLQNVSNLSGSGST